MFVLVVGVSGLLFLKTISRLGFNSLDTALIMLRGEKALAVAESCVEDALVRYVYDPGFAPSGQSMSMNGGSCAIDVNAAGSTRHLTVIGQYENHYQRAVLEIDLSGDNIVLRDYRIE